MKQFILNIFLVLLVGCVRPPLQVEVKYISIENLASYYVNTPDPRLSYPKVGQELVIRWNIPEEQFSKDLQLRVFLNMRDLTEREWAFTLNHPSGNKTISVANEDYFSTGGILSFRVEILKLGTPLYVRKHQLYVKIIHLGEEEEPPIDEGLTPEPEDCVSPFVEDYLLPEFGGHGNPREPPTSF